MASGTVPARVARRDRAVVMFAILLSCWMEVLENLPVLGGLIWVATTLSVTVSALSLFWKGEYKVWDPVVWLIILLAPMGLMFFWCRDITLDLDPEDHDSG